MISSRAAVLRSPGSPLSIENVTYADPAAGEVAVRIVAASMCHSDVHAINGGGPHLPMILGHEAAGVVTSVGQGVTDLDVGCKVALSFVPSCGSCWACIRGLGVECERGSGMGGDGRALDGSFKARSESGEEVGQMVRLGAFSDKVVVHRDSLVVLDDSTDLRIAALMSCGFLTGAGAAINIAGTAPGDDVVVVGTGGVGIAAVQGALVAGAARIIAVDVSEEKLARAKEFGATHTVNALDSDWPAEVTAIAGGRGADRAISCVGMLDDTHMTQLLASLNPLGTAVLVCAGRANLDVGLLGRKTLRRTLYGSLDPKADQVRFLDLYAAGRFRMDEMITNTYTLDSINDAVEDLLAGKNIRGIILFEEA
ncbi:zinc-binding dehydrogenase [Nocardioides sp. W7]|uniref:zinc-binding dehydrogenase n=1 Tax=Nocardioides sp. W7 TaxID=2931390 RepID=UPI001FD1405D|nr:zinc-binding dehydrogenase [Nocardioides sp. W7]